jgi:hypothetical protein
VPSGRLLDQATGGGGWSLLPLLGPLLVHGPWHALFPLPLRLHWQLADHKRYTGQSRGPVFVELACRSNATLYDVINAVLDAWSWDNSHMYQFSVKQKQRSEWPRVLQVQVVVSRHPHYYLVAPPCLASAHAPVCCNPWDPPPPGAPPLQI